MNLMKPISAVFAMCALAASTAVAADFPDRPLRLVVPYPAGGTSDIIGRMLQPPVAAGTGQPVVVDNKPGGASTIGTSQVARAAPDGYTLLLADLALLVNPSLMKDIPYNTTKDFRAVSALARAPLVMLVNATVPANTLQELMALAKSKPGTLNFGSGGYATSTHMAGEMFNRTTGLNITHVPYQGVAPVMNAILSGQVEIYFGGTTTGLQHIATGKLKAVAITGDKRSPLLPNVPTFKELGIEGMKADTYWGLYVPAGTDNERVNALNGYFRKALTDPAVVAQAGKLGLELIGNSPEDQQKEFAGMVEYWQDFVKKAGIKLD